MSPAYRRQAKHYAKARAARCIACKHSYLAPCNGKNPDCPNLRFLAVTAGMVDRARRSKWPRPTGRKKGKTRAVPA